MNFFYGIGIRLYALAVRLASPFNSKAAAWTEGRKNWRFLLKSKRKTGAAYVWFHCASLGEFEQGRPVMERIAADFPGYKIIITFFSPSGYIIRKDYALADIVSYLPLDTPINARHFLDIIQPALAVFVKYEVWPAFFTEIGKRNIPLVMLSATFRENHRYFRKNAAWLLNLLKIPRFIFVQNPGSEALLKKHGISNAILSGDTRFDRVYDLQDKALEIDLVKQFANGRKLIIFGSSWEQEEEAASLIHQHLPHDYCMLIVPHDVGESRISDINRRFNEECYIYSAYKGGSDKNIMIIDVIGLLGRMYKSASIAVVGGGFRGALHNILEAAAYGIPVCFGSNHAKFPEADDLLEAGGGMENADSKGLALQILDLMKDEVKMMRMGESSRFFIREGKGATELVINTLINNKLLIK